MHGAEDIRELVNGAKLFTRGRASAATSRIDAAISGDHGVKIDDFYAHMPSHSYLYVPTCELWPAASVNGQCAWPKVGEKVVAPATWLDKNRPVVQLTWHPALPQLVEDRVVQKTGWTRHKGAKVFNLYLAPVEVAGNASAAQPWVDHVHRVYPDDADHIIKWLAHRVQRPGEKVNHSLVLGGNQGIGKDTLLEPVKSAVGAWNWQDITPTQMLGRFNGWAKAVVVRINEARDLGDTDRVAFYEHCKIIMAAPPDVIRVDEKHLRETYVANVCGVIVTTNSATDGLYLPADDRRHFIAWSQRKKEEFTADYWTAMYQWFKSGGNGHVLAYLRSVDLSTFDPKAPPPKTAAFWQIVSNSEAPESGELRDAIEALGSPPAFTLNELINAASGRRLEGLVDELSDRKNRRSIPHRLGRVGYVAVRNPDAEDGLFKIGGRRQAVYARRDLSLPQQVRHARAKA